METLMQADIFFFISSVGFVLMIGLISIILIRVIRILGAVNRISDMIERNAGIIGDEAKEVILDLRQSRFYTMLFGRSTRRRK
jgi:hypothetical protein